MPKIKLNGANFYYEIHGQGEPLLLLHGLGSSCLDWEKQVPALAKKYRVIVPDLRGHGQSDKPSGKYSIRLFSQDIIALIEYLQIPSLHVVGLSMGGMISFQIAADRPELLKSVVILNSGPELKPRTFKEKTGVLQRQFFTRVLGMKSIAELLSKRLFPEEHQEAERALFKERWAKNDKSAYSRSFSALLGWGVKEKLPQMPMPFLILTGDMDYTPVSFKEEYVRLLPNARLEVISNSRHATPYDQPVALNEALLRFLEQQSGV